MTPELLAQFKRNYQEPADVENETTGVFNDIHALINALDAALSQAEAYRVDAELYRWVEAQCSLCIESVPPSEWTRADRSKFIPTHRVCAGGTQFAAYPTLRETIDAARKPA